MAPDTLVRASVRASSAAASTGAAPLAKTVVTSSGAARPYVIQGLSFAPGPVFGTSANRLVCLDEHSLQTVWSASPASEATLRGLTGAHEPQTFWSVDSEALRRHDVRSAASAGTLSGPRKVAYSTAVAAASGYELAAGTDLVGADAVIEVWDARAPLGPLRSYTESHSDDITSLSFHPVDGSRHLLLSASADGLFSVLDTRSADEDDGVLGVGQTGASVRSAGWMPAGVYVVSDMMTLQLWSIDREGPEIAVDYGDVREVVVVPDRWTSDYVIQCDPPTGGSSALSLYIGSLDHGIATLTVPTSRAKRSTWSLRQVWTAGHTDVVRCVVPTSRPGVVLTGGEDGAVCAWSTGRTPEQTPASSSSEQTSATGGGRFKPY